MGAGPAGLTAAYELLKRGVPVTVVEKDHKQVGGLARTVEYKGYRFDIGGHPVFSQKQEVEELWAGDFGGEKLAPGPLPRLYYPRRHLPDPIQAIHCLLNF